MLMGGTPEQIRSRMNEHDVEMLEDLIKAALNDANAQADEGFSLSGQTEQEIIADEKAEEERQAQLEREEAEAEKQKQANNLRKEIDQRNEDYANDFTLEDDTVTGEETLVAAQCAQKQRRKYCGWRYEELRNILRYL